MLQVLSPSDTHLFGDIPPGMGLLEACWWFSVHNCTTVGFAELVRRTSVTEQLSCPAAPCWALPSRCEGAS